MVKKKHMKAIAVLLILIFSVALFVNIKGLKAMHFIFSEKKQLNELVELFKKCQNDDILDIQIDIKDNECLFNYYNNDKTNSSHIIKKGDKYEKALNMLKSFKLEYGKYELDLDSLVVFYQGDKMMIRMTLSAKPDEVYEDKYHIIKLIYSDDGYDLSDYYDKGKIHKINNNWGYYTKYDYMG